MERDEAGVAVREVEVDGTVDLRERVGAAGVVEVVIADDADVRHRQALDETKIVLVPLVRAGAGEVAEVREEHRSRVEPGHLVEQLREDAVRRRVGPGARVARDDEAERVAHLRSLDLLRHPEVPVHGRSLSARGL